MLEKLFSKMGREEKGFTLIELLIVVAIIGILAAIAIPNFLNARARATLSAVKADLKNISTAVETYQADTSTYPNNLAELVSAYMTVVPNQPSGNGAYRYCTNGTNSTFEADTSDNEYGIQGSTTEVYVANGSGVVEGDGTAGTC